MSDGSIDADVINTSRWDTSTTHRHPSNERYGWLAVGSGQGVDQFVGELGPADDQS